MDWLSAITALLALLPPWLSGQAVKRNVPRLKLSYKEMVELNNVVSFPGIANSSSYQTFLLDEERGRLYVGAKDYVFSFDLTDINKDVLKIHWPPSQTRRDECKWAGKDLTECANYVRVLEFYNHTHLYACGTGAFHPICAYIEIGHQSQDIVFRLDTAHIENGRGKSPYDPKLLTTSLLIDGELYAGTAADFMSRDYAIFRTLGHHHPIRTEQHDSRWLNEPRFVHVQLIPESDNPEDDKIYFFFRENALDGEYSGKATYARIGQVCKNDFGGHRSLVNKWVTFLKARLLCSVPGLNGIDTHFDELQSVYLMNSKDPKNPFIYGIFTTSSNIFRGSAVCMYSMSDIRRVFLGPFAHREGPTYQWVPFQGRVPYPRPGTCPSNTFGGFQSTKDLPDDVITFARSHPAMYNSVLPINNRPIIIKTDVDYQFTQIVVDRVEAEDGQYNVMFIGTDVGTVLKVVSIPRETWRDLEEVLLEEVAVLRDPIPITTLKISTKQQQLYLGSSAGVSQLPLHRCDVYGRACAECCLARDPYCAWDGFSCSRYFPTAKRRTRRQDIRNGDPLTQCSDQQHNDNLHEHEDLEEKVIYGVENSTTFLECVPKSQRALVYWQFQRHNEEHKQEVAADERVLGTEQGLLLRRLERGDGGTYTCQTVEHGYMQTVLSLTLEVIDAEHLGELLHRETDGELGGGGARARGGHGLAAPHPPSHKVWYRDFLQLINHPNLNTMDELCEQVWRRERRQRKQRPPHASAHAHANPHGTGNKWKHLQESKKGRNRRTHENERAPRSV
ncbi:semaphorin-3ab isoform X2 [Callorhinchus milii]|uniref:semaphorin-3ab isoform X2 n=1 Tax=Callorhinchus milii TaxID=7868 RepID=UPI001C3F60B9|nr:semaphorin-3ab isoform X2 [Callorhinchus milii]